MIALCTGVCKVINAVQNNVCRLEFCNTDPSLAKNYKKEYIRNDFSLYPCQMKLRKLESESDGLEERIANLKFPAKANPECHVKSNNVSE